MDKSTIKINCSNGKSVSVPVSVRERWELFDNRLEWTDHKEDDEREIDVPFTDEEVLVWKGIDECVSTITSLMWQMKALKYSVKYQVICRFFDPKEPYFWLFIRMDDNTIQDEERMRIYTSTANAMTLMSRGSHIVREGNNWMRRVHQAGRDYSIRNAVEEMESTHPKDIFVYRPSRSTCPIDYATQWHPKYYRRTEEEVYDMYKHHREECQRVNSIDSYIDILITVRRLAEDVPYRDRYYIRCWDVSPLHILGLDALQGHHNWTDDEVLTPVQRWGRKLIAPYTIRGIDKNGDERVVVTKGNVRRFAHRVKEEGVGYSVLFICRLHTRRWITNKHLNRFMNILEGLLE